MVARTHGTYQDYLYLSSPAEPTASQASIFLAYMMVVPLSKISAAISSLLIVLSTILPLRNTYPYVSRSVIEITKTSSRIANSHIR